MLTAIVALIVAGPASVHAQDKPASNSGSAQVAKAVGVIKTIQPDSITVTEESGGEVTAQLTGSTKILRVPPGEKDLKNATALQAQDLQPGDRVLIRGQASTNGDGHTVVALAVIVMKQSDVAAKKQHDLEDWQKRGVDGVVTAVDAATGVITISPGRMGANKNIAVHIAKDTILRRYAPGSVQFDEAKPAPIDQIKVGDQLRARGTRSPDGSEVSAEEIVSGSFPYIEGLIKVVDTAANAITVQDVIAKTAVVVKVSPDSQMWRLPPEMAQRIAARLKGTGGASGDRPGGGPGQSQNMGSGQGAASIEGRGRGQNSGQQGGPGGNAPPDLQRMLSRLPALKLADLQKGDAVVILATAGGKSDAATAIKLVAGVEAILTAAPSRSASTLLSPWSLGAPGGEGEAAQ
ncbi:MAG: hypothetical protein WCA13_18975 [Terriglobales bacterium]